MVATPFLKFSNNSYKIFWIAVPSWFRSRQYNKKI